MTSRRRRAPPLALSSRINPQQNSRRRRERAVRAARRSHPPRRSRCVALAVRARASPGARARTVLRCDTCGSSSCCSSSSPSSVASGRRAGTAPPIVARASSGSTRWRSIPPRPRTGSFRRARSRPLTSRSRAAGISSRGRAPPRMRTGTRWWPRGRRRGRPSANPVGRPPALVAAADSGEVSGAFTPSLTFVAAGGSKDTGLGASAGRRVSAPVLRLRFEAGGEVFVCDSTDEGQTWPVAGARPRLGGGGGGRESDASAPRRRRETSVGREDAGVHGRRSVVRRGGGDTAPRVLERRLAPRRAAFALAQTGGFGEGARAPPLGAAVRSSASDGHLAFIADSVDEGASWVTRETSTGLKSAGGDPEATRGAVGAVPDAHRRAKKRRRGGDELGRGLTCSRTWTNTRCKHPMTSGDGAFEGFAMTCVGGEGRVRFYMATTAGFRARAEERRGGEGGGGG